MTEVGAPAGRARVVRRVASRGWADPDLPEIERWLDPREVARRFARHWPTHGPAPAIRGCSVHHVRWTPSLECVVSFWLDVEPVGCSGTQTIGVATIGRGGETLRLFDHDTELPGIAALVDAARTGAALEEHLGQRVEACALTPVRYRPGERCTWRVEVTTRSGPIVLYAKVLSGGGGARLGSTLRWLEEEAPVRVVPPLVAEFPEWQAVVVADAGGRRVALDEQAFTADALHDVERCGALLARFHRLDGGPACPAGADRGDELESYATAVERAVPAESERFAEVAAEVARARAAAVAVADELVPSHGAFRLDQVRFETDRGLLIDLDTFCLAEAERDLGNALAYVRWWGLRRRPGQETLDAVRAALQDGYARADGADVDADRLRVWEASSLLKIAGRRCRRLATHEWVSVPDLIDAARTLLSEAAGRSATGARAGPRGGLGGLAEALDPGAMSTRLTVLMGAPVRVRTARLVSTKPGVRAVVVYDATAGGEEPTRMFGKVFDHDGRTRRLAGLLAQLGDAGFARGEYRVPELLGHLPDLGMVVFTSLPGVPLGHLTGSARSAAVTGAARWLTALHRTAVDLDRVLDMAREVSNLSGWGALVSARHPHLADEVGRLVARLLSRADGLEVRTDVTIHKDFQYGHVLVDGSRIGVVDLDEARAGDPAFDVAHFCANLRLLGLRGHPAAAQADRLESTFVREYASATGYEVDDRHAFFEAYTYLKIAKQLAAGRGPGSVPPGAELAGQVAAVIGLGARALSP